MSPETAKSATPEIPSIEAASEPPSRSETAIFACIPSNPLADRMAAFAGRIYDRHGPRVLVIPGMALVLLGLFLFIGISHTTAIWTIIALHIVFAIGLAMMFGPLMTTALGALPEHLYSHGSAIINTLQQLAAAAGIAGLIAVYNGVSSSAIAEGETETVALAERASAAFMVAAVIAVIALVATYFISEDLSGRKIRRSNLSTSDAVDHRRMGRIQRTPRRTIQP